jgi:hypothetical protein
LVPFADADDVPLSAALLSFSNLTEAEFQLREYAMGSSSRPPDAGVPWSNLALTTECLPAGESGAVCVGKPRGDLKSQTWYEWSVAIPEPLGLRRPWQRFFTGSGGLEADIPNIEVQVLEHVIYANTECGPRSSATVKISSENVAAPVVVSMAKSSPGYIAQAVVLSPDSPAGELIIDDPPECVKLETFDPIGVRAPLRDLCVGAELPPTTVGQGSQDASVVGPESPTHRGCILSSSAHDTDAQWGWIMLASTGVVWGRRRSTRTLWRVAHLA